MLLTMSDYKIMPGRRAGDGWLVVLQRQGEPMDVLRSFETRAEALAEAERLAAAEPANLESDAA
jgi:hypothetical protein